ncbi:MAG: rod shape-determining protein RodA [Deltaproteobacteria bacterium]|nr:rod shape-determining protein RodA [Deltaproteobacteria bacterium]
MKPHGQLRLSELHWPLVITVVLIALLGVYNLHSAAAARDSQLYAMQAMWMGIGAIVAAFFLFLDYRFTERLAYPFFTIIIFLLLAVLGQGHHAKGAVRWLRIGPVNFQPSEFAKLAAVFCLSRYFHTRIMPDGYTIGSLVRPFNLSRPLAVIAALIIGWKNLWLTDPLGQLARFLRSTIGVNPKEAGDLLWFRIFILFSIASAVAFTIILIIRRERSDALLNPWPPTRRKRLITLTSVIGMLLVILTIWYWKSPWLRDPLSVIVLNLVKNAAPLGQYAKPNPGYTLRVILVIAAAIYLLAALLHLRHGVTNIIDMVVAPVDLMFVPPLLILVQPDLGTAGIVILISASIMLIVGIRLRSLVILGIFGIVIATIGWAGILKDYQKRRVITFMDPEHDKQGAGWNAVQSMIAVGSGQWTGKGHKGGTQTQLSFLPEQHTDFAFSVWGEEQGFLGSSLLVVLYLLVAFFGFSIAADAREHYGGLLAAGATAIILWQALINMSMVIGLFPVVGITLPLFSYGGTSVVTVMLAVGILLNVHWRRRVH